MRAPKVKHFYVCKNREKSLYDRDLGTFHESENEDLFKSLGWLKKLENTLTVNSVKQKTPGSNSR